MRYGRSVVASSARYVRPNAPTPNSRIDRYSRPGKRVYQGYKEVKRVLDGLGIAILSTSRGVMSDRQAKKAKVGGEIICTVW